LWSGANEGWWPLLWFVGKVVLMLFVFVWVRASVPRLRYDQFMRLGWKVLLPLNLVWMVLLAVLRFVQSEQISGNTRWLVLVGLALGILLVALVWPARKPPKARSLAEQVAARPSGSFPVPSVDLQVPPSPRARRVVAERV